MMNSCKRFLFGLLALVMLFCAVLLGGLRVQAPTTPALNPTWSKYNATNISQTNAKISATVNYGKKLKADSCGFYLGTAKDNLTKVKKGDTISESRTYTNMSYGMNKYGFTLKAGTTYYYRFYVIVNGEEYVSDIKSFTTTK